MARDEFRDVNAEAILAAYERAKKVDPKLTQAGFMMAARPGKYRNRESAARYFRLLREGKRSGRVLYRQASSKTPQRDLFQIAVKDKSGNTHSFNLEAVGAKNAFDNASVAAVLKQQRREMLEQKAAEWRRRYNLRSSDLMVEEFDVRHVSVHRTENVEELWLEDYGYDNEEDEYDEE